MIPVRTLLPSERIGLRSSEPPPGAYLEPLAKSAPLMSVATKERISLPSVDPSASIMTMMSPRAAWKPSMSALPLPRLVCTTTRRSGRSLRATAMVSSVELPSTRITSSIQSGSVAKTWGRFSASFIAGTMTLTLAAKGCLFM